MNILIKDIPQADQLEDVIKVVNAVRHGRQTYQEMATVIKKVERQGRYYRRAAEILGFIQKREPNKFELTASGKSFIHAPAQKRAYLLTQAVLRSTIFQRIIPFLESTLPNGCSRSDLESFVEAVTNKSTPAMFHRRVSTIISWLQTVNLLQEQSGRYILKTLPPTNPLVDYVYDTEPLLPTKFDLSEYINTAKRIENAGEFLTFAVRQAERDRAINTHVQLTNLVAEKIRRVGAIPRRNRHVDLAARIRKEMFIFEIKSTTEDNIYFQIRSGISQLYEYRYLQGVPDARLVLVIEKPLRKALQWIYDYLVKDRGILIVWDDDGDRLHFPSSLNADLRFLQ